MAYWRPKEIIVNDAVKDDPVTNHLIAQCPGIPVKYVASGDSEIVKRASDIISQAGSSIRDQGMAGKQVVYISPGKGAVDTFSIPDARLVCPHFVRIKLGSNACYYT
jgi:hypothetical protein